MVFNDPQKLLQLIFSAKPSGEVIQSIMVSLMVIGLWTVLRSVVGVSQNYLIC